MSHHENNGSHGEKHEHHIVPFSIYFKVWAGLLVCTVLTVSSSYFDFGALNTLIAMVIATIKALMVVLFFMGLKYEGQENNVTFFATFAFLAIFVGLTSADIFYRVDTQPVKVDSSNAPQSGAPVDVAAFTKPSPELIAKGKTLFSANCASCHGADGKGDGPAAAALVPHPRNFTAGDGWKFGREITHIFKTITNGSPGTPMPPFSGLPTEDRFALAQYVQSLGPSAPADSAADIAALQAALGSTKSKPHLSVERAMDKVSKEWEATHGR